MARAYGSYAEFLDADPRRRGDALEIGHDYFEHGQRYRVCWYEETGELTAEGLAPDPPLELSDFHAGITGSVSVLAVIPTRVELEVRLGPWPGMKLAAPRTIARLHGLVGGDDHRAA